MLSDTKTELQRSMDGIETLQSQLTFRISVLSKLLDQQMAGIAGDHDLSLGAYRALATIQAFGQLTAADLTRYTAYDKAMVSRQVGELSARDLIDVRQDPAHGRRKILRLTQAGQEKLNAARPAVEARRADLSSVLTPAEEGVLISAIEKLSSHLTRPENTAA